MLKRFETVVLGLVLGLTASVAERSVAGDWPQHLGPTQDAVSGETGLLDEWPVQGPRELWRHDVGLGYAGVAIVDGRVFLNDRRQGVEDVLRVFDLDTGEERWRHTTQAPGRVNFPGTRSTPAVTDTHIYTTGGFGHVQAINRKTQKPDWVFNVYERYPDNNKLFGFGISPILVQRDATDSAIPGHDNGLLLISPTAQGDPAVIAVDPKTGKTVWQSQATLQTQHTFHTPVIRTLAGHRGITARDQTHFYFIDIATGKTLIEHKLFDVERGPHVTIPPVTVLDSQTDQPGQSDSSTVFATNGYENGTVSLTITATRNRPGGEPTFALAENYRIPEGSQVHPAIYFAGHLYMNINENANLRGRNKQGGLACIDAQTGEVKWKTKGDPNLNRGAITLAEGKLYVFDGDTGELMLVDPMPDRFEVISKFTALKPQGRSNNAWSPIVVSNGRIIIRDHRQIVCFDLRK